MGQKKDNAPPACVFKLHMNCDDCVKKIKDKALEFPGVEKVEVDPPANELKVFGKVNPAVILDHLKEAFTKKGVRIVSGGNKEPDNKTERKKSDVNKKQDKKHKENEWTKLKREVKEKDERIKRLTKELEDTRNEAENERIKAQEDLQEKLERIRKLELKCHKTSERAKRQVEGKVNAVTSASSSSSVAQACVICCKNEKNMVFGCGHMTTCAQCGERLSRCPICRANISNRIKVYLE